MHIISVFREQAKFAQVLQFFPPRDCQTSQYSIWLYRKPLILALFFVVVCFFSSGLICNFSDVFVMIAACSLTFIRSPEFALFYNSALNRQACLGAVVLFFFPNTCRFWKQNVFGGWNSTKWPRSSPLTVVL